MNDDNGLPKSRMQVVLLFYRVAMPSITIILLLGISSLVNRPIFMGSMFIDISIRVLLCFWFCIGYIRLPDLGKKYRVHPNIEWKKSDVSSFEKLFYSSLAILFGFGIVLVTWWMLNAFLPIFKDFNLYLAIVNGAIYVIPLVMQYEIFKL